METTDPRLLLQQIKQLEARIQQLEANSLAFSAQQKGPLPGFLRAVRINDTNQAGAMWMNFTNAGPGLGPYAAVTDTNDVIRAEWGNLAANGNSPAQYGFRAINASGTPIFDSLGLINAANLIGSNSLAYGVHTFSGVAGSSGISGLGGEVTLLTTTFTLSRTLSVLILMGGAGSVSNNSGGIIAVQAPIYIRVTGQANSAISAVGLHRNTDSQGVSDTGASCVQVLSSLPANTYTVNVLWNSTNGTSDTLSLDAMGLFVVQLGS